MTVQVLVVDNYDSFTYNLVQYLGELGARARRRAQRPRDGRRAARARARPRRRLARARARPTRPASRVEVMRRFPEAGVPTLGVCLGHQSLAQAFGGKVVRHVPVHGKTTEIEHDGTDVFAGLPSPLTVGRYHSLVVDDELPDCFERHAPAAAACVMGIRHRELPAEGVQFHPESVLTDDGQAAARELPCLTRRPHRGDRRARRRAATWRASRPPDVLREIMDGNASEAQIAALPDRAAHEGRDGRRARRPGRARCARSPRPCDASATTCSTPPAPAAGARPSTSPPPPR